MLQALCAHNVPSVAESGDPHFYNLLVRAAALLAGRKLQCAIFLVPGRASFLHAGVHCSRFHPQRYICLEVAVLGGAHSGRRLLGGECGGDGHFFQSVPNSDVERWNDGGVGDSVLWTGNWSFLFVLVSGTEEVATQSAEGGERNVRDTNQEAGRRTSGQAEQAGRLPCAMSRF